MSRPRLHRSPLRRLEVFLVRAAARPLYTIHGRIISRMYSDAGLGAVGHLALKAVRAALDVLEMNEMRESFARMDAQVAQLDTLAKSMWDLADRADLSPDGRAEIAKLRAEYLAQAENAPTMKALKGVVLFGPGGIVKTIDVSDIKGKDKSS